MNLTDFGKALTKTFGYLPDVEIKEKGKIKRRGDPKIFEGEKIIPYLGDRHE